MEENRLAKDKGHPNHWFNRSLDLHAAAGAVWYAMHDGEQAAKSSLGMGPWFSMGLACEPVYHMLCGLSLELGLKAIIAQQGEKPQKQHTLSNLARDAGMELSDKQNRKLEYLSQSIIWAGRYPTPLKETDENLKQFYELEMKVLTDKDPRFKHLPIRIRNNALDWEDFHSLWEMVVSRFTHS